MQSEEIRRRFLEFFRARGHAVIPSASLVPENDPSVLFTTAGMQPLVPYLLGEPHPLGKRLANAQKCVRMQDIEEVGDNTHDTFFEMLGNWSLGDYFKKEQIGWFYDFLTSKEEGLGLNQNRFYVTVFAGNKDVPRDDESKEIWLSLGIPEKRIYFLENNWWSPGENGPCGPDSEVFYDLTADGLGDLTHEEYLASDKEQRIVEIGNSVFMEYEKKDGKVIGKLSQKNVDFGGGLERLTMAVQVKTNIFETDLFLGLMTKINELKTKEDIRAERIVADHIRTATFLIADGITPSNTDRGYILRRLLRRAVRYADMLGMEDGSLSSLSYSVVKKYTDIYSNLAKKQGTIEDEIRKEEEQFRKTLKRGLKALDTKRVAGIRRLREETYEISAEKDFTPYEWNGKAMFDFYQTYGFPFELLAEELIARYEIGEHRIPRLKQEFDEEMEAHQDLSRAGAEKKFKGGLADTSEISVKYHTATHLLHKALRSVLGEHVFQKGSNITPERLRFDFSHPQKMTAEEVQKVEDLVNEKIKEALPVFYEDIPFSEAEKRGAVGLFGEKYGDTVRVYQIGEGDKKFSLEFCGGPHVKNTSELGHFKITKEEAVAAGVRRIKAILNNF